MGEGEKGEGKAEAPSRGGGGGYGPPVESPPALGEVPAPTKAKALTKPAPSAAPGGKRSSKKAYGPPAPITNETIEKLGERPTDKKQGALWDKVAARLDSQVQGAIPLEADLDAKGKLKTEPQGDPKY